MNEEVLIEGDEGAGRTVVVLYTEDCYRDHAVALELSLAPARRVVRIKTAPVDDGSRQRVTSAFAEALAERQIRHAHIVAFGSATIPVQAFCLAQPKVVRSLILVDGRSRVPRAPSKQILDRLESSLPLGFPFRNPSGTFDSRAFLQRVRCPVLLLASPSADDTIREEQRLFAKLLPTCWYHILDSGELAVAIERFLEMPVRCPQKGAQKGIREGAERSKEPLDKPRGE